MYKKLFYALLITSRKLRHYFESHKITVVTDFPLGDILHNRDATGRISKWAVELGALNINFTPRKAIKSQALPILWPSGQRFNSLYQIQSLTTGRCTLMGHSS